MFHLVAKILVTAIVGYYVVVDMGTMTPLAAPHTGPRLVAKLGLFSLASAAVLVGVWLS